MKLNPRELEVLKILHDSDRALTSTEIVNAGAELTQSTVQAVLRKLLAAELVEVQGVTHSGNVLSRTFGTTAKSKEVLTQKFFDDYKAFSSIISKTQALAGMFAMDEDLSDRDQEIAEIEALLAELKKKLKKK
ncbi:MAG: MarR family transcriptional regulator [bacterium]|nr:MarR family transcriptional regulator [bacterium]MCM1376666.1 MarR family transcriptional regulator [Muribaculum sp.]